MHKQQHSYWLDLMQQSKYRDLDADNYNEGPLVDELENRIAVLLGKPGALFFNKGTSCQLAALKVHCEQQDNHTIMLHPQSHIALDEQDAYQTVMNLSAIMVGQHDKPITLKDVEAVKEKIAVLVIELPLRRAGFKLPEWQELLALRRWCDDNQVIMHLDGARLWESAAFYEKNWSTIAQLFNSAYVSLYKGIGGISGAVLVGDVDFLELNQVWRDRLGSNMWTTFPVLITALEGLDTHLKHISGWVKRAKEIAKALQKIDGLIIETPQTNAFQIRVNANIHSLRSLNKRLKTVSKKLGIIPCKPFSPLPNSQLLFTESQVGSQHAAIRTQELIQFFKQIIKPE